MKTIEFYYDVVSPYSFLGYERMNRIVQNNPNVRMVMRPCLLGGIMKGAGNTPPGLVPAKWKWMLRDLQRGFDEFNITIKVPNQFPVNTLSAMRLLTVLEGTELQEPVAKAFWNRYWIQDQDITSDQVQESILAEQQIPQERITQLLSRRSDSSTKSQLLENTRFVLDHDGFGLPLFVVDGNMADSYFGSDRIDQMMKLSCKL